MADLIKFKCKACGKKMGVRREFAGKKARCTGCKQALRVPTPRPRKSRQAATTGVPVAVPGGSSSPGESSSISLEELAALEHAAPAHMAEMTSRARARAGAPQVPGGKECPGCGSSIKPDAVICVHCGHNYETGRKLKTKKESKIGKALSSASASASAESGGGAFGAGALKALYAGGVFVVLGAGAIFYDWDLSDSGSRKSRWIGMLFDTLGPVTTGTILIGIGVMIGLFGLAGSRE